MELDVLAFGAHPDDVELAAGGTLIKLARQGARVGLIDLTEGELSTRGSVPERREEAQAAASVLGARLRSNLQLPDGNLMNTREMQLPLVQVLRAHRPKLVLHNAPSDRHPDHGQAHNLVRDACFLAGLAKMETRWEGQPQEPWRPLRAYAYVQDQYHEPSFLVDVTEVWETKLEAIRAYGSQFFNPNRQHEPETYISTPTFWEYLRGRALHFGQLAGVPLAEGFLSLRPPLVSDPLATLPPHGGRV